MFKNGYEIASKFTQPLIVAYRFFNNSVESGLGTFIILNNEGWIMTAAHNLEIFFAHEQHRKEMMDYQQKIDKINSNIQLKESEKKRLIKTIKHNKVWVTDCMIWLGNENVSIQESHIYIDHDIAFLRVDAAALEGFTDYPKIKDPNNLKNGTSLCKLGFPFYPINATFDNKTRQFNFPPNLLPIPRFPIEGIYTRNIITGQSIDGTMDVMYIETSSPGLKGQSGGPIIDTDGNIYAVQSKNLTLPLGFTGTIEYKNKQVDEHQFINVGIGVHTKTITTLLNKHNIKHEIAP
jgi:hypothetical protein